MAAEWLETGSGVDDLRWQSRPAVAIALTGRTEGITAADDYTQEVKEKPERDARSSRA
jgi:hypothetical protein